MATSRRTLCPVYYVVKSEQHDIIRSIVNKRIERTWKKIYKARSESLKQFIRHFHMPDMYDIIFNAFLNNRPFGITVHNPKHIKFFNIPIVFASKLIQYSNSTAFEFQPQSSEKYDGIISIYKPINFRSLTHGRYVQLQHLTRLWLTYYNVKPSELLQLTYLELELKAKIYSKLYHYPTYSSFINQTEVIRTLMLIADILDRYPFGIISNVVRKIDALLSKLATHINTYHKADSQDFSLTDILTLLEKFDTELNNIISLHKQREQR